MDKEEFFLLIPAVIYGQALIDVLKVFHHKKTYWEIIAWGVILIISIIGLWVELYHKLAHITEDAFQFIVVILQAILYAQLGRIITPEASDINTKNLSGPTYETHAMDLVSDDNTPIQMYN